MGVIKHKICLLGAFSVGKTSLAERFVHQRFDEKYLTTVGVSVSQKLMPPIQNKRLQTIQQLFLIWDIAALEQFDAMMMNYFRGAAGALAVADVTRPETVEALEPLCQNFRSVNPEAALVAVGNKSDLRPNGAALPADLKAWASKLDFGATPASAKTGRGVDEAFMALSKRLADKR